MTSALFERLYLGDESKGTETLDLVRPLLVENEIAIICTKGLRDGAVFTDRRIIVVNKQGILGKKIDFTSIPLRAISAFSIENSGTFDLDAELKVWGTGFSQAVMQFTKGFDVKKLGKYLADNICR